MTAAYDDRGIRFSYPDDWEADVTEDGPRTTISLQSPGSAFAFVSIDETCPSPADEADQALEAMREEYPGLQASAAPDTIDGQRAVGYDLEFFSLDSAISCSIRCFGTPRRTVLIFGQWPDLEGDEAEAAIVSLWRSMEETDG